jgi:hypothetical protein
VFGNPQRRIVAMDALTLKSVVSVRTSSLKRQSSRYSEGTKGAIVASLPSFARSLQFPLGLNCNNLQARKRCDERRSRRRPGAFELRVSSQAPSTSSSVEEDVTADVSTSSSAANLSSSGVETRSRLKALLSVFGLLHVSRFLLMKRKLISSP